jgi:D-alanyl-lipoteichoic acid acyltransferase DltB (MBOAT superfamily)
MAFAVFLPLVFILYWAMPHKFRWILLFAASYYFYMSWNAKYVFLILFTTVISYSAAIFLEKQENRKVKK